MVMKFEISKDREEEITRQFQLHSKDTKSADLQVGLLTERMMMVNEALELDPDSRTLRLTLVRLIGKRRKLLDYLNVTDSARYQSLMAKIGEFERKNSAIRLKKAS